jgi:hypothetical protein
MGREVAEHLGRVLPDIKSPEPAPLGQSPSDVAMILVEEKEQPGKGKRLKLKLRGLVKQPARICWTTIVPLEVLCQEPGRTLVFHASPCSHADFPENLGSSLSVGGKLKKCSSKPCGLLGADP